MDIRASTGRACKASRRLAFRSPLSAAAMEAGDRVFGNSCWGVLCTAASGVLEVGRLFLGVEEDVCARWACVLAPSASTEDMDMDIGILTGGW